MKAPIKHLAIIMDGNGRWAEERGEKRSFGHKEGARKAQEIALFCAQELRLDALTLYAFSAENWSRPAEEVNYLWNLSLEGIRKGYEKMGSDVCIRILGDKRALPKTLQKEIAAIEEKSKHNTGMKLSIALSYGGRQEITQAVRSIAQKIEKGQLDAGAISMETIQDHLLDPTLPDPDLLIRTGGQMRTSNFLLWQSAYTELYFSSSMWPEFSSQELCTAIASFEKTERRFGSLSSSTQEA